MVVVVVVVVAVIVVVVVKLNLTGRVFFRCCVIVYCFYCWLSEISDFVR